MRRLAAGLALALISGFANRALAVDLDGFWYVLVHYQDSETEKSDRWRWDDRVWNFAKKGDRLEWTEYPIVEFSDNSGRFEATRGGRATRVLGKWEPSPAQLADIKDGLAANSRGVKTKTLRSAAGGTSWTSGDGGGAQSALVITYSETWTIEGLPDAPVFARDDSMGSATTESMSGRTVYKTETVPDGDTIEGTFERDGTRTGRFRMIRSAQVGAVASHTQEERHKIEFQRSMEAASDSDVAQIFAGQLTLPAAAADADPKKAHAAIRESVEGVVRASGNNPGDASALIDRMTAAIEKEFASGKTLEQVQERLATGQLGK